MILPDELKRSFWAELQAYEEERRMPYITSVEEIGFERGCQAGRQEGERSLVVRLLTRRVGALSEDLQSQVEAFPWLSWKNLAKLCWTLRVWRT